MAFDYVNIRENVVNPLMERFGKAAQISVNIPSTGEPWESQLGSEELHDVTVIQTTFEKEDNRGTLVQETDVLFLVSTKGVDIDPSLADRIIADGVTYQVVRIDPLQPGPTTMLWSLHGRK